jgi:hypothetical protein
MDALILAKGRMCPGYICRRSEDMCPPLLCLGQHVPHRYLGCHSILLGLDGACCSEKWAFT